MKRKRSTTGDSGYFGTPKKRKRTPNLRQLLMTGVTDHEANEALDRYESGLHVASTGLAVGATVAHIAENFVEMPGVGDALSQASDATAALADVLAGMHYEHFPQINLMSQQLLQTSAYIGSNKKWPKDAEGAIIKLDHTWTNKVQCSVGREKHQVIWLGDVPLNYYGTPTNTTNLLPNQNFFDLNPNENISGSDLYTTTTNPSSDKLFSIGSKGFIDFSNLSNIGIFMTLSYYKMNQVLDAGVISTQQAYLQSENLGTATIALPASKTTQSKGSTGFYATGAVAPFYEEFGESYVGMNPNAVKQKIWKMEKAYRIYLPPTACLRHNHKIDFHEVRSRREMDISSKYQKGTWALVLSFHGEVVNDSEAPLANAVHGPCGVGLVGFQQISFQTIRNNQKAEPIRAVIQENTSATVLQAWTQETAATVGTI